MHAENSVCSCRDPASLWGWVRGMWAVGEQLPRAGGSRTLLGYNPPGADLTLLMAFRFEEPFGIIK